MIYNIISATIVAALAAIIVAALVRRRVKLLEKDRDE